MTVLLRTLIALATVGAVSFPNDPPVRFNPVDRLAAETAAAATAKTSGRRRGVASPSPTTPAEEVQITAADIEYYLSPDAIAYIRPGLKMKVNSLTIGTDRKPVVDVTITDIFDQPLDREGKLTPGRISLTYLLAWYNADTRLYTSYLTRTASAIADPTKKATQATGENNGVWTLVSDGRYTYKFNNALPEGFDKTKTHTLGIYGSRVLTEAENFINKTYYVNVLHDFRPDGAAFTDKWDKIAMGFSCHNCHDAATFGLHGGSRRDVKLCVLCHSPQTTDPDTGNSVDMALMIHKIHTGNKLTKPYTIIGFGGTVFDFTEVTYPQDRRNCENCHVGTGTTAQQPTQKHVYFTYPSRRACGACHDAIDWTAAVGTANAHTAGPQSDDATCATCHIPDSGAEYDASIKGGHTITFESKQLAGIKAEIVSVTNAVPGQKPTVTFKLTNKAGAVLDGTKLSTFSPIHAGPTSSYTTYYRESGVATSTNTNPGTFNAATGLTSFTFANAIPASAKGTWAFSADIYKTNSLVRADGKPNIENVRDAAINPIKYVALTGTLQPRRVVVDIAKCNKCHDKLALHGGQRLVELECVMCHNPTKGDAAQRVAGTGEEESVSFQRLIHRIHTGLELTQDFTVYGNRSSVNNYNEVTFPGDRRNCNACHVNNSQFVPAAGDAVVTKRDYFSPQGSGTAACLGCHDNRDAAAHAFLNTTQFGGQPAEACGTCHGEGADWAVSKVHAR